MLARLHILSPCVFPLPAALDIVQLPMDSVSQPHAKASSGSQTPPIEHIAGCQKDGHPLQPGREGGEAGVAVVGRLGMQLRIGMAGVAVDVQRCQPAVNAGILRPLSRLFLLGLFCPSASMLGLHFPDALEQVAAPIPSEAFSDSACASAGFAQSGCGFHQS